MKKGRDSSFDVLKGFLIILVIIGHVIRISVSGDTWHNPVYNTIYLFHMPMFIFISGYFSNSIGKKTFFSLVRSRAKRILVPWAIYTLISVLFFLASSQFDLLGSNSTKEWKLFLIELYYIIVGYWFLLCVFTLSLMYYPVLRYRETHSHKYLMLILLIAVIWGLSVVFSEAPIISYLSYIQIGRQTLVFGIGLFFYYYQRKMTSIHYLIVFVVAAFCAGINFCYNGIWFGDYNLYQKIFNGIMCAILVFMILKPFANYIYETKIGFFLAYCGVNSLGIYTIHFFLLSLIKNGCMPYVGNSGWGILIMSGINLMVTILIIRLIKVVTKSKSYLFGV